MSTAATLPRVLFVAGMGRSGSTVLAQALGAAAGVCNVGELRYIWQLGFIENQFCGCGERFLSCPFWSAVIAEAFPARAARRSTPSGDDHLPFDPPALRRRQHQLLRARWMPLVAAGRLRGALRCAFQEFATTHAALYRAIAAVSGAALVLDASKYAAYGVAVRAIPGADLAVVHLVRDSRGVANSILRPPRDPSLEGRYAYDYRRPTRRIALNWWALNLLTEAAWPRRDRYMRLRYEDFAAAPGAWTARVLDFAGLAGTPNPVPGDAFTPGVQHTVAGNPARLRHGSVAVSADNAWRHELPHRDRRAVTALTAPLLMRYGYRPWSAR